MIWLKTIVFKENAIGGLQISNAFQAMSTDSSILFTGKGGSTKEALYKQTQTQTKGKL